MWRQVLSHAPDSPRDQDAINAFGAGLKAASKLLREGHSFSGNERNCVFLNCRHAPFANVSSVSGLDFADDGRALGVTDWDQDGDLDVWMLNRTGPRLRLMQNQTIDADAASDRTFLAFQLQGTQSHRDAIGSRLTVTLPPHTRQASARSAPAEANADHPQTLIQTLRAGDAYLSQSSKWLHFGLGTATAVERVTVRWPSGTDEQFAGIRPGGRYLLVEGSGLAQPRTFPKRDISLAPRPQPAVAARPTGRTFLANRLPMPLLRYRPWEAPPEQRILAAEKPLLITLWASWCAPCLAELKSMSGEAQSLRDMNLRVLALSVDGLDDTHSTDSADARAILDRLQFPFDAGWATAELLEKLDLAQGLMLNPSLPLAVPTSFLFDARGELAVIYRGAVDLAELARDIEKLDLSLAERRDLAIPMVGRWLNPPRQMLLRAVGRAFEQAGHADDYTHYLQLDTESLRRAKAGSEQERHALDAQVAATNFNMGLVLLSSGDASEAVAYFRRAVQVQPEHVNALVNLGTLLARGGRREEAIPLLQRAVAADATSLPARSNLAGALNASGRFSEAAPHYQAILLAEPNHALAHSQLGRSLLELGDMEAAAAHLRRGIELNPRDVTAALSLAWLQATCPDDALRDGASAMALAARLHQQLGGKDLMAIDVLAAAQAEQGNFAAAQATLEEVIGRLSSKNPSVGEILRSRLAKYKERQPYRDVDGKYP